MKAMLLEISGLSVDIGGRPALQDVSLEVAEGEAVALLGGNGAGKTTLLKAILGLVPASGRVVFRGQDLAPLPPRRRARLGIGYAPEGRRVFRGLTVAENLDVAAPPAHAARIRRRQEALALFPALEPHLGRRAWQLSGGQQQMLAIARALMGAPALLLLDEPSLGLAPIVLQDLYPALRRIAESGTAVLVAEQNLARTGGMAHRVAYIEAGSLRAPHL
jgi:branched-chain amino acid transport system ATP-binding protein